MLSGRVDREEAEEDEEWSEGSWRTRAGGRGGDHNK